MMISLEYHRLYCNILAKCFIYSSFRVKIKVLSEFGDVGRCIFVPSDGAHSPPASSLYVKLNVSRIYQYRTDRHETRG